MLSIMKWIFCNVLFIKINTFIVLYQNSYTKVSKDQVFEKIYFSSHFHVILVIIREFGQTKREKEKYLMLENIVRKYKSYISMLHIVN